MQGMVERWNDGWMVGCLGICPDYIRLDEWRGKGFVDPAGGLALAGSKKKW